MPLPAPLRKIYILDTSVILYDNQAIQNFEENDVAIPITVLEELDNFKQGNSTKSFEAREFIRYIDQLSEQYTLKNWIPLNGSAKGRFRVIMDTHSDKLDATRIFDSPKADHKILNAALSMQEKHPDARVVLVTKDINLRLKAKALNLPAEDYKTGKIEDIANLYSGNSILEGVDLDLINQLYQGANIEVEKIFDAPPTSNHYFILRNGSSSVLTYFNPAKMILEKVDALESYGIRPRNALQSFAMHALLNPDIKLVSILGGAGTGKTLLALAGAIEQRKTYRQILVSRPIIPLSNKDIGYLPGDIKSKIDPYMQPLWDNLRLVKNQFPTTDGKAKRIDNMVEQEKIVITPLAYIRGRSLAKVIFIVDEAQNLTPHEIKTIITRAGEGTKIIFTGDINQIDTPYLDAQSNGLSYMIDRLKGRDLFAHVTLRKGERSELANIANELL
jgi:PhoH-like ATPase